MTPEPSPLSGSRVWKVLEGQRGIIEPAAEDLVVRLLECNSDLWSAEDQVRAAPAASERSALKARIDELNATRVGLVFELDQHLHEILTPDRSAPPLTDTPGSVCDRLSVLSLRLRHTAAVARERPQSPVAQRLPALLAQADELRTALDVMLSDVTNGTRRFTVHAPNRLYGKPSDCQPMTPT